MVTSEKWRQTKGLTRTLGFWNFFFQRNGSLMFTSVYSTTVCAFNCFLFIDRTGQIWILAGRYHDIWYSVKWVCSFRYVIEQPWQDQRHSSVFFLVRHSITSTRYSVIRVCLFFRYVDTCSIMFSRYIVNRVCYFPDAIV